MIGTSFLSEISDTFNVPWGNEDECQFILEFKPQRRLVTYHDRWTKDNKVKLTTRLVWFPWTYMSVYFHWRRNIKANATLEQMANAPYVKEFNINTVHFAQERALKPNDYVYDVWLPNVSDGCEPCIGARGNIPVRAGFTQALNIRVSEFFDNSFNDDTDWDTLNSSMVLHWLKVNKIDGAYKDEWNDERLGVDPWPELLKVWSRLSLKRLLGEPKKAWGPRMRLVDAINTHQHFDFKEAKSFLKD